MKGVLKVGDRVTVTSTVHGYIRYYGLKGA
jgi:hypothetical protein